MVSSESVPSGFDTNVPHIARVYDYWLGGKDNYAADRAAGDAALQAYPDLASSVRANRAFLARAVTYLVREAGIRQFLDIGTGIPTANNTHEVAQVAAEECSIVYVDNDPIVLAHARALLDSTTTGRTAYIDADLRNPGSILEQAARVLDFQEPIAVMLVAVLHCITDDDRPHEIVEQLMAATTPGSSLTISHPAADIAQAAGAEAARRYNERASEPATFRDHASVARFFDGLELVPPGLVKVPDWKPDSDLEAARPSNLWGGVAFKLPHPQ
jgi:hypothetical protein